MFKPNLNVDANWILERVSESQIALEYTGVPVRIGTMFRSPLRKDQNPTCVFTYHKGRLRYRDWAESRSKDVFDLVSEITGLSYHEALQDIAARLQLKDKNPCPLIFQERQRRIENEKAGKKQIKVKRQAFTKSDIEYLKQFGITADICKAYRCYSVKQMWLDGKASYVYSDEDPAIAYYFGNAGPGEERWKIYFYKRKRGDGRPRFLCNTNRVAGLLQVPDGVPYAVLTKSMKDVMSLARFGIPAFSMQNETTLPYKEVVDKMLAKCGGNLYSLYDFDRAGISMACQLRREYGIRPLFFTDGSSGTRDYGSKDFSDYVRDRGVETAAKMVERAKVILGLQ